MEDSAILFLHSKCINFEKQMHSKSSNKRIAYCQINVHDIAKYNTDVKCKVSAYFIIKLIYSAWRFAK